MATTGIFWAALSILLLWSPPPSSFAQEQDESIPSDKAGQKKALIESLFTRRRGGVGIDTKVPPTTATGGPVTVVLKLVVIHVAVDEDQALLRTTAVIVATWRDRRLKWDVDKYYKVRELHVSKGRIWKPDILTWNSLNTTESGRNYGLEAVVYASGTVILAKPAKITTSCDLDYTHWPWDKQNCHISLGSWTKTTEDIFIQSNYNRSLPVSGCYFPERVYKEGAWRVDCDVTLYLRQYYGWGNATELVANLRLDRLSTLDKKVAVLPNSVVACLALATFWTHPKSRVRFLLCCTNLLLLSVLLFYLRACLPSAGAQMPLIVVLTGLQAVLTCSQLLTHLAVENLLGRKDEPPAWLLWPLRGPFGKVVFCCDLPLLGRITGIKDPGEEFIKNEMKGSLVKAMEKNEGEEEEEEGAEGGGTSKNGGKKEDESEMGGWVLLAQAADRLAFVVYAAAVGVLLSRYLVGAATYEIPEGQKEVPMF